MLFSVAEEPNRLLLVIVRHLERNRSACWTAVVAAVAVDAAVAVVELPLMQRQRVFDKANGKTIGSIRSYGTVHLQHHLRKY